MKKLLIVVLAMSVSACSLLGKIPDRFNEVEYGYLAELKTSVSWSESCDIKELSEMKYLSSTLVEYSRRFNDNNKTIYANIDQQINALYNKDNPSPAYCKIKRKALGEVIDKTLDVYGRRL